MSEVPLYARRQDPSGAKMTINMVLQCSIDFLTCKDGCLAPDGLPK